MQSDGRYMMSVNYEYSKKLLAFSLGRCPFLYAAASSPRRWSQSWAATCAMASTQHS